MSDEHVFDSLVAGRVTCLFTKDPAAAHASVESWACEERAPHTLVTLEWEHAPRLASGLDDSAIALAQAVFSLFPSLYMSAPQRARSDDGWRRTPPEEIVADATARLAEVTTTAARSIVDACQRGEVPKLARIPTAERVRQLSLALDPECLAIVLLVHEPGPLEAGTLLAFGKGAQWLARNSGARVVIVAPHEFAVSGELDSVRYRAQRIGDLHLESLESDDDEPCALDKPKLPRSATHAANTPPFDIPPRAPAPVAPVVSVSPIIGRPHAGSDAELVLYDRITSDPDLGSLFHYNQLVPTKHGIATPRVDLIWPEGKLVVEIDGHADHSRRKKFRDDRVRDYYLLVSGYRVLRLDDTAVLDDPELTLARIRAAVLFLREERNDL